MKILAAGVGTTFATTVYDHKPYELNRVHGDFLMAVGIPGTQRIFVDGVFLG